MPTNFEILFDQPDAVYYPGQVLKGKVKIVTTMEKSVRAIHIKISGHGKVQWDEGSKQSKKFKPESYSGTFTSFEKYLSSKTYALVNDRGQNLTLPPGIHEYEFSAPLPPHLPMSIFASCGHVKYEVLVKLERPLRFDKIFKKTFTILKNSDLNAHPVFMQPLESEETKRFCIFCWESGPVVTKLWIPFGGYVPGQILKYAVIADNKSSYDVEAFQIQFIQRIIFTSKSPYKKTRKDDILISSVTLEGVQRYSKKEIIREFVVPIVPPSTLENKAIIKIEYCLKAIMVTGFLHRNDSITIPIVIGTKPILNDLTTNPNNTMPIVAQPTSVLAIPISELILPTPVNEDDQLISPTSDGPPSYENATKGLVVSII